MVGYSANLCVLGGKLGGWGARCRGGTHTRGDFVRTSLSIDDPYARGITLGFGQKACPHMLLKLHAARFDAVGLAAKPLEGDFGRQVEHEGDIGE